MIGIIAGSTATALGVGGTAIAVPTTTVLIVRWLSQCEPAKHMEFEGLKKVWESISRKMDGH
jgi:hypothetical protein